jgi:hypothetical protein
MTFILINCTEDPEPFTRSEIVTQSPPTTTATGLVYANSTKAIYQLNMRMGHEASECTGCVVINGVPTHVPCRGPGTSCSVNSVVQVSLSESHISLIPGQPFEYYTVTSLPFDLLDSLVLMDELRNDDFFLFPDRSFWVSGNFVDWRHRWMNIPEQYIKRNTDDSLLYYDRVTFTSSPLFNND